MWWPLAGAVFTRRAGITVALQQLEAYGLINRERGIITILDRAGLQATARPLN